MSEALLQLRSFIITQSVVCSQILIERIGAILYLFSMQPSIILLVMASGSRIVNKEGSQILHTSVI